MLKVVKIIEGGIDLQTQEQLPRSLVISNGSREVEIPLSDAHLKKVVGLLSNGAPSTRAAPAPQQDRVQVGFSGQSVPTQNPMGAGPTAQSVPTQNPMGHPQPVFEPEPPPGPEGMFDDDEGFEPGEDFVDRGTGAGSL